MQFSQDQKNEIEYLAGLAFDYKKIALFLQVSVEYLEMEYRIPTSEFRYHYDRGKLLNEVARDKQTHESAANGSVTALQEIEKKLQERKDEDLRDKIVNGY